MIVIGIDPGATGAAVMFDTNPHMNIKGPVLICRFKAGYQGLEVYLRSLDWAPCCIYLEQVHGMPHDTGGHAFTFGRSYGRLEGMADMMDVSIHYVPPKKWIKELQIAKKATRTERKQENQRVARVLYSDFAKQCTLDVADALLIAEYGRRMEACCEDIDSV